jgi:hypothetical protein
MKNKHTRHKKTGDGEVKLPERARKHAYDDEATMVNRRWVPERS